ncbi:hypothetical protein D3W54_15440 [Komagataeibacter medellinensis]|uniref:Outer membrane protein n=1 Tax=Komagataeibacter medellinensis TaxID=1177712 RepID=A0ABQ6VUQ4_9PROT|nr:hypothetical protein [Komagataeibacter medellinensis]KAB8122563.1 hypothetical protein D3W54_15440 [Komagataeibacter medellinensis]
MRRIIAAFTLLLFPVATALAQSTPMWKSYAVTGNPSDIVPSPAVASWFGKKVDAAGGASDKQTLTNATLGAVTVNLFASPALVTCPVGSCPPATSAQLAYSAVQQYGVTSMDRNWELGAVFGLIDTTGGGTGEANDHTDGAKMGAYVGLMQTPTGGPGWAFNSNIVRCAMPGSVNSIGSYAGAGTACTKAQQGTMSKYTSTIGYELDVSNFDQDSNGLPPTSPFVVGQYITTTSFFSSYAGVFFGIGSGQSADAWHNGIMFSSPGSGGGRTVSDNTISDLSNSDIGYHAQGLHATATLYDQTTGKYGLWIVGNKAIEDIDLTTTTPVGLAVNGSRSSSAIHVNVTAPIGISDTGNHGTGSSYDDGSSSQNGMNLHGAYTGAAVNTQNANATTAVVAAQGQQVCWSGYNSCVKYDGTTLVYVRNGVRVASIDNNGNMTIKGTLTQNGSP